MLISTMQQEGLSDEGKGSWGRAVHWIGQGKGLEGEAGLSLRSLQPAHGSPSPSEKVQEIWGAQEAPYKSAPVACFASAHNHTWLVQPWELPGALPHLLTSPLTERRLDVPVL